jgi:hypothetical protein
LQTPTVETSVLNGSDLRVILMPACASELWIAANCSSLLVLPEE